MSDFTSDYDFLVSDIHFIVDRLPNPNWQLVNRINDYYVIAFARGGRSSYTLNGKRFDISKNDIIFIPSMQLYTAVSDQSDPWSFVSAGFSVDIRNRDTKDTLYTLPNIWRGASNPHIIDSLIELSFLWTNRVPGYLIKCRSLLLDILYIAVTLNEKGNTAIPNYEAINFVREYINNNYNKNFTVEQLSRMTGFSVSYFRSLFKRATGMTTVEYHNYVRIAKAKDLLLSHSCNVTETASAVGFNDIYYFSRLFKKITGKSPSDYNI